MNSRIFHQLLSVLLSCIIVFQPSFIAMAADRPTVVDSAAPKAKQPTMDTARNGVPIEQIATPDKNGVSHNMFKDFNVGSSGLVINNSRGLGNSELAGFIKGNPHLSSGEARLIINEVTGGNRSHLEGYTELHGRRADYILANPNGITVNGGGFLNFPKAVLTTGRPQLGENGLDRIDVQGGDIRIDGSLDASNVDSFTLLTRAALLNADIHAQDLNVLTGRNSYDPVSGALTPHEDDGTAVPAVSVDSRVIGGMYANRIVLQGTEKGVGVNLDGVVQSVSGLELTADGRIQIKNTVTAGGDVKVASGSSDIAVSGDIYSGKTVQLAALGDVAISGFAPDAHAMVGGAGGVSLSASKLSLGDADIAAGLQKNGRVQGGTLQVDATESFSATDSSLVSGGSLAVESPDVTLDGGKIDAAGDVSILAQQEGAGRIDVRNETALTSLRRMGLATDVLETEGNAFQAKDVSLVAGTSLDLGQSVVKSTGSLELEAPILTLAKGGTISSQNDLSLSLDTFENNGGLVYSQADIGLHVGELWTADEAYIVAAGNIAIDGRGDAERAALIHNEASVVESLGGKLTIAADEVENIAGEAEIGRHEISWDYFNLGFGERVPGFNADGTRYICNKKRGLDENKGGVNARLARTQAKYGLPWHRPYDGRVLQEWIHTTEEYVATPAITAELLAATDLTIDADSVLNDRGVMSAGKDLTITANTLENMGLELSRRFDIYRNFHQVHSGGSSSYGQKQFEFNLAELIDTVPAVISAKDKLTINVPDHVANEGFKVGQEYTGTFAGTPSASDLEVTGTIVDPNTGKPINSVKVDLPTGIGSLYVVNEKPDHKYAIETNPVLSDPGTFYGSDYFFDEVGVDVDDLGTQLLGDAFFETNMVRKQVLQSTGRRYLKPTYTSDADQFRQLMDNAAKAYAELDLRVGASLSEDQLANLHDDIVWYEKREVLGREVLVPVVYLASATADNLDLTRGAMLTGSSVEINTAQLHNSGAIEGASVNGEADDIYNEGGRVSGGDVSLSATKDIVNESGTIKGDSVGLSAGRDVRITTRTEQRDSGTDSFGYLHQTAEVAATDDLSITSGRDTAVGGAHLSAGDEANIDAGGNVVIGAKQLTDHLEASDFESTHVGHYASQVSAGEVNIHADENVAVSGSTLVSEGDTAVDAGESVILSGVTNSYKSHYEHSSSGGLFGGGGSTVTDHHVTKITSSSIAAGGDVSIKAGQGVSMQASSVQAGQDATLESEDSGIALTPGEERSYHHHESSDSGFMGSGSMELEERDDVVNVRSEVAGGGKVTLKAKDDIVLEAARISSGDETEITSEEGQVALLSAKDSHYKNEVSSSTGFFSWSSKNEGTFDENVLHTQVETGKGLKITTAKGVVVEYKETGDLQQDIRQLAQSPGLSWMNQLIERDDVDWQAVAEVHEHWKEESSGIGGPGMTLVALAVAVALTATGVGSAFATWATGLNPSAAAATGAAGTAAAGSTGAAAGASLTTTQLALHTSVAAGFNSLVTQAGMQLVGNKGDIGAALEALASEDTVRSLATTMITAGLTQGLLESADLGADTGLLSDAENLDEALGILTKEVGKVAINSGVSAGVDTAINGGDLGENMVIEMRSAAVSSLGAKVAHEIGKSYAQGDLDYVSHKIAHVALGGALAAANGGDVASGAIGGGVGEITGEILADQITDAMLSGKITPAQAKQWVEAGVDISKLAAGVAAAATSGDVDSAADAAGNASKNNCVFFLAPALSGLAALSQAEIALLATGTGAVLWAAYQEKIIKEGAPGAVAWLKQQMNSLFEGLSDEERKELAKPLVNVPPKVDTGHEEIPIQEPIDQSPPPYPDNADDVDTGIETYPARELPGVVIVTSDSVEDIAESIANGHSWGKHVDPTAGHKNYKGDLEGKFVDQKEFSATIQKIMENPDGAKELLGGRAAWWSDSLGMIVIYNPNHDDKGTAFKPKTGKHYFDVEVK